MKGKDMIKIIQERNLEDMDLEFIFSEIHNDKLDVRTFNIDELCDIGYSSNEVSFTGEEK